MNNKTITVAEALNRKQELEKLVQEQLQNYYNETGLVPHSIDVNVVDVATLGRPQLYITSVKINVALT
jgi:hypothetical protein